MKKQARPTCADTPVDSRADADPVLRTAVGSERFRIPAPKYLFGMFLIATCFHAGPVWGFGNDKTLRQTPIVKAIQKAQAAVVNIQGNKTLPETTGDGKSQTVNGMGTGVIIDSRGYVVTNYHVVHDVAKIEVTLSDGTEARAKLLNFDAETDLALIKLDLNRSLTAIEIGSSEDLLVGEQVIAIGNPFGYNHSATVGIISSLHRNVQVNGTQEYKNLIQTSADINPGNSGGPLINIEGDMIGINVAVRMGAQGIGFAIPVDNALEVVADLVAASQRQRVGLNLPFRKDLHEDCPYLKIDRISDLQTANFQSQFQEGDRIESIDGKSVRSRLDLELALIGRQPGDLLTIEATRGNERITLSKPLTAQESSESPVPNSGSSLGWEEELWNRIGVHAVPVGKDAFRINRDGYSGGLRVTEVRPNSQASQQSVQNGDILVGIMRWKTATPEDLHWVLRNAEFRQSTAAPIYVYRNNVTYTGTLQRTGKSSR